MEERNDIVIYKSEDGLVKMEAMVDPVNETIWANQKAIAALFGVTVPNISYHLGRIFKSGELEADAVVKEFLITAQSGVRGTSDEKIRYYNLDAIISIGYRVNSIRANKFRIWATNVIKQYMCISDASLVALTLMIAESHTDEMDTMVKVVVSLINRKN